MTANTHAQRFKTRTGYQFKNPELLIRALTHSSLAVPAGAHNERLEFLGDRVLALVIADALFHRFPKVDEGDLARRLNMLVRKETCAEVARALDLSKEMAGLAGKARTRHNVFDSTKVLGDACEAVLAAVYLDGGFAAAQKLVLELWAQKLEQAANVRRDPKSALQEWALSRGRPVPEYKEVSRTGPDHEPEFEVSVSVAEKGEATGKGRSKRGAEQDAATNLLKQLKIRF